MKREKCFNIINITVTVFLLNKEQTRVRITAGTELRCFVYLKIYIYCSKTNMND